MSLRACSNRFLILRNHTGMVIFFLCWSLFALDQIQLDAYCTVVWRWYEVTFKLRPVIPIFERKEMTECPRKSRQPTSIGIQWHIQPYSTQSARSVSYRFNFRSCAFSRFSSQETVNSMRTLFFESDHAPMSVRFSVWIMWTGNCRNVLRSAESFQALAPFSSFILKFFCFLTEHSLSLWNWIMGFLAVTGCWFAASHCALNNSMTPSNTLLCRHIYIWSHCGCADSIWCKVPRSLLHEKHRSESVYPHNFRLVAFGRRSYVERRRNDIASDSIAIKDFHDNWFDIIPFCPSTLFGLSNSSGCSLLLHKHPDFFAQHVSFPLWIHFREYLVARATQPSSIGLRVAYAVFDSLAAFRLLGGPNGRPLRTWFYFWIRLPNDIVESFITVWRCTFPILSSTSEDIWSCRFPELVYKPTFEKEGGTPSHIHKYMLLYCWIRSMQASAISYICKGHKKGVNISFHLSG